jgi:hypothetical protein
LAAEPFHQVAALLFPVFGGDFYRLAAVQPFQQQGIHLLPGLALLRLADQLTDELAGCAVTAVDNLGFDE